MPLIFVAGAGVQRLIDDEQASRGEDDSRGGQDRGQRLEQLKKVRGWLDDAMRAGRELLHRTHPVELDDRGWDAAASEMLTRQFPESSIEWQVETADETLSPEVCTGLFRIVTEAVRNAIRHGKASDVVVGSSADAGRLIVRVRDQGRGFDPDDVPDDRFGIRSMRGRAELLGGTLTIDSRPGGPTEVRVEIPIDGV